jgi:hypothetical protein
MLPAAIMEMRANYTAPACKWHHHPPRLVIGLINRTNAFLSLLRVSALSFSQRANWEFKKKLRNYPHSPAVPTLFSNLRRIKKADDKFVMQSSKRGARGIKLFPQQQQQQQQHIKRKKVTRCF